MNNQPNLTNFPRTLFATAKRQFQAKITSYRLELVQSSLSGYALLFEQVLSADFLKEIDSTKRQRSFGQRVVFWAWLAQILELNASCSRALSMVQAWYQSSGLTPPKGDTGAYCKARLRLPMSFLQSALNKINKQLTASINKQDLWKGHVLKAIDGTSVTLMDTEENQLLYPQHKLSKPGCGFPIMGMVGVVNLSHGGWEGFQVSQQNTHDLVNAVELIHHINEGDVLLADRAYSSYEFIARIFQQRKAHIVSRLHQGRHRALNWEKGKQVAKNQWLFTWQKPKQRPIKSRLTKSEWNSLPDELTLRYIKKSSHDRSGAKKEMVIITTLLDTETYSAEDIAGAYLNRWDIEVKLRDVKTTLGMESFEVKTPEMAHKTLYMMMIAYNLIRSTIQKSAAKVGRRIVDFSFKGVLDIVVSSHEGFRQLSKRTRKLAAHYQSFLKICGSKLLSKRPNRKEPRAVKRRSKNFQLLTSHRHTFQEILHREKYRKPA